MDFLNRGNKDDDEERRKKALEALQRLSEALANQGKKGKKKRIPSEIARQFGMQSMTQGMEMLGPEKEDDPLFNEKFYPRAFFYQKQVQAGRDEDAIRAMLREKMPNLSDERLQPMVDQYLARGEEVEAEIDHYFITASFNEADSHWSLHAAQSHSVGDNHHHKLGTLLAMREPDEGIVMVNFEANATNLKYSKDFAGEKQGILKLTPASFSEFVSEIEKNGLREEFLMNFPNTSFDSNPIPEVVVPVTQEASNALGIKKQYTPQMRAELVKKYGEKNIAKLEKNAGITNKKKKDGKGL